MIIKYSFNKSDIARQKRTILNIKGTKLQLKTCFKDYFKLYTLIFIFFLIIIVVTCRNSTFFWATTLFLLCFITSMVHYFFQAYSIEYDSIQESLMVKRW